MAVPDFVRNSAGKGIVSVINRLKSISKSSRTKKDGEYTDKDLVYAAHTKCLCGHGMAYPEGCGPFHYWDCSAILKGTADRSVKHEGQLPFTFWEIKSEKQPSARGATTRP